MRDVSVIKGTECYMVEVGDGTANALIPVAFAWSEYPAEGAEGAQRAHTTERESLPPCMWQG